MVRIYGSETIDTVSDFAITCSHNKKSGFVCKCNPESMHTGPLCDTPSPCTESPCTNNGLCSDQLFQNGTVDFSCDCRTTPGFFGKRCELCPGGVAVNGVCIQTNSCLENVQHCAECDNRENPNYCLRCLGNRFYNSQSNLCEENRCFCDNGVLGECVINNRFMCESCFPMYKKVQVIKKL